MSNLFTAVSAEQQEIVAGGVFGKLASIYESSDIEKLTIKGLDFKNGSNGPRLTIDKLTAFDKEEVTSDFWTYVSV